MIQLPWGSHLCPIRKSWKVKSLEEMRDKDHCVLKILLKYLDLLLEHYISLMKFLSCTGFVAKSFVWQNVSRLWLVCRFHLPSFSTQHEAWPYLSSRTSNCITNLCSSNVVLSTNETEAWNYTKQWSYHTNMEFRKVKLSQGPLW